MVDSIGDPAAWLQAWFRNRAPQVTLDSADNFFQAGAIDSFSIIELIEEMETTFSVRFQQDDFQDRRFSSIGGLAMMLNQKRGA